jgi:type VI secretion system secreted protein Hcp
MKIEGIDGDVTATGHEKWIECHSLQWGVGRGIHTPTGSSAKREASSPSISEVTITKTMDASSPKLFTESCVGTGKTINFHLVKTGQNELETYMEYTLTNGLISGYSVSTGGDSPSESLSFNFTKVEMKFTPYDNEGTAGDPVPAGYDVSAGKKI